MTYHLNRALFVENGPTVLAERTREALAVSHAYRRFARLAEAREASPDAASERAAA